MIEINSKTIRFLSRMGSRGVLGQAVIDMAENGKNFFALSADLGHASGFMRFMERYPDRFINTGIAEQNLIGVSAGISADGTAVIATSWAMFATLRCADQLRNFLGYMQRNIKLVGMDSGMAQSKSSYSHCNPPDLALLRAIPGLTILSPCDGIEIYQTMWAALEKKGPVYIRLTGDIPLPIIHKSYIKNFEIGKAILLRKGQDIALISCGAILSEALKAADILEKENIHCSVIEIHTIKPLDTVMLDTLLNHKLVAIVEEHSMIGGLGSAVAEYMACKNQSPPILFLGAADVFPKAGTYNYVLHQYELMGMQLAESIRDRLKQIER